MEERKIFFLTQDQLIGTDFSRSIEEFTKIVSSKHNWSYLFSKIYVNIFASLHMSTIEQYKKGFINSDIFLEDLTQILGLEERDKEAVKNAWNKMCEISPEKKNEILDIAKSGNYLLIVSYSNELHRDYISSQLNDIFVKNNLPKYETNKNFYVYAPIAPTVFSTEELACEAIEKFKLNKEKFTNVIYSLNENLNNDSCRNLEIDIRNYSYDDFISGNVFVASYIE